MPRKDGQVHRTPIGADCLTCSWQTRGSNETRKEAIQHARSNPGHEVHHTVEEVTIYEMSTDV